MNLNSLLAKWQEKFRLANKEEALSDVDWVVSHVLGCQRTMLRMMANYVLTPDELALIDRYLAQRLKGKPLAYILESWNFYGYDLVIRPGVLIPRFETEELVAKCLEAFDKRSQVSFIDMCCGSGCIGIALALELPDSRGILVDYSSQALDVSQENIDKYSLKDRLTLVQSDLFKNLSEYQVDLIVSNPPYILNEVTKGLKEEVKDYEPMMALDGGKDGLDFYRRIVKDAHPFLHPNGILAFEIGYDQKEAVIELMMEMGYVEVQGYKDMYGRDRMVIGKKLR